MEVVDDHAIYEDNFKGKSKKHSTALRHGEAEPAPLPRRLNNYTDQRHHEDSLEQTKGRTNLTSTEMNTSSLNNNIVDSNIIESFKNELF